MNGISSLPNEPQMISKNGDHEKSPDPYLLGRLMGSSYANYPSAFSIASRGVSNPVSSQQLLLSQNQTNRGFNMKSSDEPIYVPGAYMVGLSFTKFSDLVRLKRRDIFIITVLKHIYFCYSLQVALVRKMEQMIYTILLQNTVNK